MLATVLPVQRPRLTELASRFEAAAGRAAERSGVVVHGDVHEAQVIVRRDVVTGLLDIDDVGPGDPLDDMATLLGHLRCRARAAEVSLAGGEPGPADLPRALHAYADRLRAGFAEVTDPDELDVVTAAVITGLATGPFRVQQPEWPARVTVQLEAAEELLDRGMRGVSAGAHGTATPVHDRGVRHPISTHDQEESS
jgi:aminoglycoside phosphotransferase (APT) family kinase protein